MAAGKFDRLYLSPHLDDVALSCGGQIFQQAQAGQRILMVTVAAGEPQTALRSPFAQFLHHSWDLRAGEVVAMRRAEDQAAAAALGIQAQHLALPDAIYRLHPDTEEALYASEEAIFGPVHTAEERLVPEIAAMLAGLPAAESVVAPLGVGHHVDHQLTRRAAEAVFGPALLYYEDYPYVQEQPHSLQVQLEPRESWQYDVLPLSENALRARVEACLQYGSQLKSLFNDAETMEAQIRAYVAQAGGERLWQRRA